MRLTLSELGADAAPGLVIFFDSERVFNDPCAVFALGPLGLPPIGLRPFLFVASDGERCAAMPVTTRYRPERIELQREWKTGDARWRTRVNYVADLANIIILPVECWMDASAREIASADERMRISAEGVRAVLQASAADCRRHAWRGNRPSKAASRALFASACYHAGCTQAQANRLGVDFWADKAAAQKARNSNPCEQHSQDTPDLSS